MKTILVCGGRDFKDAKCLNTVLSEEVSSDDKIIHGKARGADTLADKWARDHNINVKGYAANWTKYGHAAGPIRNKQMLVEGKPDLVIAFPGGVGTANMIKQAEDAGVEVLTIQQIGKYYVSSRN